MANIVQELGDNTTREVKPDFESGRGYYWMKQVRAAIDGGTYDKLPHAPEPTSLAKASFREQVYTRLARRTYGGLGVSFDADGKIIRE